jgi:hypothetical protein
MFKLRRILIALLLLISLAFGAGWMALNRLLSKEAVVAQLESSLNCAVAMESFTTSAFSFPASLHIEKLKLTPRDAAAVNTGVDVESIVLHVSLWDLLRKRITVEKLHISGVYVRDEVSKEGHSPLAEMFGQPTASAVAVADAVEPAAAPSVQAISSVVVDSPPPSDGPAAAEEQTEPQALSINIKEALLDRTLIHIVDRKARNKRDIHDLRLRVYDVDIDPNDLAQHNRCMVEVSGRTEVIGRKKVGEVNVDAQFLNVPFRGSGRIRPFDPVTGALEPHAELEVVLAKDALIGGHLTMGEAAGKDKSLKDLEKYLGLDLSAVPIGGVLQADLMAQFQLAGTRVEWVNDARMTFADYAILMRKGSWSDSGADDSRMALQFMPSAVISEKLLSGITGRYGDGVAKAVQQALAVPEGGTGIDFVLSGPLSKPSVTPAPETMQRLINAVAGNSADLLKGLLGR